MKLKISKDTIAKQPKKYVRLIVTEDPPSWHRLVETKTGQLEYRLGAGKYKDMTPRKFRLLVRSIVQAAKGHQIEFLALNLPNLTVVSKGSDPLLKNKEWVVRTIAENLHLAAYEFTAYRTKGKNSKELKEIVICGGLNKKETTAFKAGEVVATATNQARDIINTPACDMTPQDLAKAAKSAVAGTKATVKVLGEKELRKLKMGALLAVGQGSRNESKLIVIEYWGAGKKAGKPIVLAGKGITYDTGGLNVKPSGAMHDMHMDMGGSGAVIGTMAAIAKLKLKKNVVAVIASAENAVSDKAMRAGDIVTAMNGMTIEVMHTDAEGRMVLADALTYSERFEPKVVLDVATLTGAALVALGQQASAVMTKDEKLQQQLCETGEESGDYMWPLPLWDEYQPLVKSARADIANLDSPTNRFGGAICGGIFLSHFAPKKAKWAHIDIAPRMTSAGSDKLAKGATGEPVRMLVRFIEKS
mgnify:CR=1 FL=1